MVTKLLPTGDCSAPGRDFPSNVAIKALPVVFSVSRGQGIQTRALFRDNGALAAFLVCGVTAFFTHRAAHGRTAEERSASAIGLKAGEQAPAHAILPTDAELNMMAQKYFQEQGSGDRQSWDLAFENGYTDGFKKTHGR